MEFKDPIANLTRKCSLVVRDFPPGCGSRPCEFKKENVRKTKFLSLSEIMQQSPEKRSETPAREVAATVTLHPGLVASSSSQFRSAREEVFESLKMFRDKCNELAREKQASSGQKERIRRIDLKAWTILKNEKKILINGKRYAHGVKQSMGANNKRRHAQGNEPLTGPVPGVEIGDKFYYRVELLLVGLHRYLEAGIDYKTENGEILVTSVVASSDTDNMNNPEELTYVGSGGISSHDKLHEDQKLVRGNLAMKNSIRAQNPIRVIRKVRASIHDRELITAPPEVFVYDGLYEAKSFNQLRGDNGRLILKFKLKRIPGQPPIARFRG